MTCFCSNSHDSECFCFSDLFGQCYGLFWPVSVSDSSPPASDRFGRFSDLVCLVPVARRTSDLFGKFSTLVRLVSASGTAGRRYIASIVLERSFGGMDKEIRRDLKD